MQWLGAAPSFTLPVSEAQSQLVATGNDVVIDDGAGQSWNAVAAGRSETDAGTVVIALEAAGAADAAGALGSGDADTAAICGDSCDAVPVDGQTLFVSRVVTVETVHGVVVPSAALQTDATGLLSLVDSSGVAHAVEVGAEASGMSVVTGVAAGLQVRVPVDAAAAVAAAPVAPGPAAAPDAPTTPATSAHPTPGGTP